MEPLEQTELLRRPVTDADVLDAQRLQVLAELTENSYIG